MNKILMLSMASLMLVGCSEIQEPSVRQREMAAVQQQVKAKCGFTIPMTTSADSLALDAKLGPSPVDTMAVSTKICADNK
jgi:uncharacterized protein YcfL